MQTATDPNASQAPSLEVLAPLFPAYEFEGFIAEGGMGWVYLARQISLDRPVAIKILQRELGADPQFRASFEAEAKAMARLNHSNLIGVYDFGDADGLPFIVMEFVNGKSLHHSAYGRSIDPAQAGQLVSAISRGLAHAHNAGILHRDIKPGNILLDPEAKPKIGDFGLAQPMDKQAGAEETIYGTPGYTAPEVYHRRGDHRADIFSVGVLLHELLTGALPDGKGTPPSRLCACPRAFDAIVARATNPNPNLRYTSAKDLAEELDKAVAAIDAKANANASPNRLILPSAAPVPVLAAPVATAIARPAPAGPVAAGPLARAQLQAQAQKKSPALAIAIVAAIVAIIVVAAMMASGGGGGDDSDSDADGVTRDQGPGPLEPIPEREKQPKKKPKPKPQPQPNRETQPDPPAVTKEEVETRPPRESPLVALAKLRSQLASGSRDEFPPGTESRGGSHFVLADRPMTWTQAKAFAEEHGAHLAILPSAADRTWFREKFRSSDPVWIGAGMAANDRWQWLDASAWNSADTDIGVSVGDADGSGADQRCVALGSGGELTANADAAKFEVALQWRDDGSNPATTGAQLKRTAESIKQRGIDGARFPVGTRSFAAENSHFFHLPKASSWENARLLAIAAGGYLAVPSSKAESDWIRASFGEPSGADALVWIGGYRLNPESPWQWLTREAWNYSGGWLGGSAPVAGVSSRLLLRIGGSTGWVASDGEDGAARGMLLEWSPPKQAATITSFDLDSWLGKTDANFAARVQADIEEYQKERGLILDRYVRNIKRLGRKYESAAAGLDGKGQGEKSVRTAVKDAVREIEKSGKLPSKMPAAAPDEFHDLQKKSETALKELDDGFEEKLNTQLELYTQGLAKQAAELTKNGFDTAATALSERVASVDGESGEFLKLLALEDPTGRSQLREQEKKAKEKKEKEKAKEEKDEAEDEAEKRKN